MSDRFKEPIKKLLTENGPMGVNAIASALSTPVSTVQNYLIKHQSYFVKNYSRKWELPEYSAANQMDSATADYSDVIDNQIQSIQTLARTLMSQLETTTSLMRASKSVTIPVAEKSVKSGDIDPSLINLDKKIKDTLKVFSKFIDKVPEMYQELLNNVDIARMTVEIGTKKLNEGFNVDITSLFLEQTDKLPEETLQLLKDYQLEE